MLLAIYNSIRSQFQSKFLPVLQTSRKKLVIYCLKIKDLFCILINIFHSHHHFFHICIHQLSKLFFKIQRPETAFELQRTEHTLPMRFHIIKLLSKLMDSLFSKRSAYKPPLLTWLSHRWQNNKWHSSCLLKWKRFCSPGCNKECNNFSMHAKHHHQYHDK